jgi:hypothetical protein
MVPFNIDLPFNVNKGMPLVLLIRKFFNESLSEEVNWLPINIATILLLYDPDNGLIYKSGHIDYSNGESFFMDRFGSSV